MSEKGNIKQKLRVDNEVELENTIIDEILEERVDLLEEKVEKLTTEKNNYYRQAQRLKADFSNFRKRARKEKEEQGTEAKCDLIFELLPVIDNFERALQTVSGQGEEDFKKGVNMIYKQLLEVLKKEGLEVISAEGEMFDHQYHEAVMQIDDKDADSGTVLEVLEKGYLLGEKVIRPARVKVAK